MKIKLNYTKNNKNHSNSLSSSDRFKYKLIEKSCTTLNNFQNHSTKEISASVLMLKEVFMITDANNNDDKKKEQPRDHLILKALECKLMKGLIKIIEPPHNSELNKDEDRIFTDPHSGILNGALELLFCVVRDGLVLVDERGLTGETCTSQEDTDILNALVPIFKKILLKTSKKIALGDLNSNNTNINHHHNNNTTNDQKNRRSTKDDSKALPDENQHHILHHHQASIIKISNNSLVSSKVISILVHVMDKSFLSAAAAAANNSAEEKEQKMSLADLILAEGFPALFLKNITSGIDNVKKFAEMKELSFDRGGDNADDTDDTGKEDTVSAFCFSQLKLLFATTAQFALCCLHISLTKAEQSGQYQLHRQLEQQNAVPLLLEALTASSTNNFPLLNSAKFKTDCAGCLHTILHYAPLASSSSSSSLTTHQEKNKNNNNNKTIVRKFVENGSFSKVLKLTKFDDIDRVSLQFDDDHDQMAYQICSLINRLTRDPNQNIMRYEIVRHDGIAIMVKLLDHESASVRREAGRNIGNMCSYPDSNQQIFDVAMMFIFCGAVKKTCRMIESETQDLEVRLTSCRAIRNIFCQVFSSGDATKMLPTKERLLHDVVKQDKIHVSLIKALCLLVKDFAGAPKTNKKAKQASSDAFDDVMVSTVKLLDELKTASKRNELLKEYDEFRSQIKKLTSNIKSQVEEMVAWNKQLGDTMSKLPETLKNEDSNNNDNNDQ